MPTIFSQKEQETQIKETREELSKIKNTITASHRILYDCKTVFPFDIYPDRIIIDENKVDIIYGLFAYSSHVFSIPLKNISGARSTTTLFFGDLDIDITGFETNPDTIKHLKKKDAVRLRRIINGLVITFKEGIDISKLPLEEAKKQIEEIGRARAVQK